MKYKLYELVYADYREQIETHVEESVISTAKMYASHYNKHVDIWNCDIKSGEKTTFMSCITPNGECSNKSFYGFTI